MFFLAPFRFCPRYSLCWMEVDRKEYSVLELSPWRVTVLRGQASRATCHERTGLLTL